MKRLPPGRRKRGRHKLTWAEGIRGLIGRKGIGGGRLERQTRLGEEDNIINKCTKEDVNTLCSLLNNNNNCDIISGFIFVTNLFVSVICVCTYSTHLNIVLVFLNFRDMFQGRNKASCYFCFA
jgi:hypothetical protein